MVQNVIVNLKIIRIIIFFLSETVCGLSSESLSELYCIFCAYGSVCPLVAILYLRIHPLHLLSSEDPSLPLKLLSFPRQPGFERELVLLPPLLLFLMFPLLCLAWRKDLHLHNNSRKCLLYYIMNFFINLHMIRCIVSFLPLWPVSPSSPGPCTAALSAGGRGCMWLAKVSRRPTAPAACCLSSGCLSGCGWLSWACSWAGMEVWGPGGDQHHA